jgi:23S rRNA (guanosine2251-2'-O)-methyltransferase
MTQETYVGGINAVVSLLTHSPDRVQKVWIAEGRHDKRMQAVFTLARAAHKLVQTVPTSQLNKKAEEGLRHQGVLAAILPKPAVSLDTLLDIVKTRVAQQQPVCVLALDNVTDPHNLGAILRVADAAGITAVLLPKRGGLIASPVVYKASAGAIETMDCVWVANLAHALEQLKKVGCWVVGAMCDENAKPYTGQDWAMATVLLMGAEGEGIGPRLQSLCDFSVTIPMFGQVQSLNVSCATTLLLYEWRNHQPVVD